MKISFKTKIIALITGSIIIIFVVIGITFSITRTSELKREIIDEAVMYVHLTNDKIGDAFVRYYKTGFFKFREILLRQLEFSSDLTNIQIIGLDGTIYFDKKKISQGIFVLPGVYESTQDSFIMQNIKMMETQQKLNGSLKIIAPYIDEYGIHNYSIVYFFSMERLKRGIAQLQRNTALLCLGIIAIGFAISILFANSITSNLYCLTRAAEKVAVGDFFQSVEIKTNDEFEELAKVFNFMTSKIRQDVKKLKDMINELKKKDAEKTQFIANLSHELRTPLTAALGYVDYMAQEKLGPITQEQLHSLNIIKRNLERLTNEIRALLEISRYSLEGVKVHAQPVKIQRIIEPILTDLKPQIEVKNIKVRVDYEDNLLIYADQEQLKTVFENIINNAIKFSPQYGELGICARKYSEDNKNYVAVAISDQGIGIPAKRLEKGFEPFYQVDSSTRKKFGGIGLGLTIAKSIIEAHHGRIWGEKNRVRGITFKFIIPYYGGDDVSS